MLNFARYRHPGAAILLAVSWYLKYRLSYADIVELLLERGVNISRETAREWVLKFGPEIALTLDRKRRKVGWRWHVDETYMKLNGEWVYVYRAVDQDMEPIDIYVSETRDKAAAKEFFRRSRAVAGEDPESIRSDAHNGYDQVETLFPNARHHRVKCLNNKAESSHVPIKQRYRPMRGFKNLESMKVFCLAFEAMYRYFRLTRPHNRERRELFAAQWNELMELAQVNCA